MSKISMKDKHYKFPIARSVFLMKANYLNDHIVIIDFFPIQNNGLVSD